MIKEFDNISRNLQVEKRKGKIRLQLADCLA